MLQHMMLAGYKLNHPLILASPMPQLRLLKFSDPNCLQKGQPSQGICLKGSQSVQKTLMIIDVY